MDKATADATDKYIDELETVYAGKLHQYVQKVNIFYVGLHLLFSSYQLFHL